MIVNHVLLKLKDRSPEHIEHIRTVLLGMRGKIEVLLDIQVDANVRPGPSAYDLILITRFASLADMEEYLIHPAHLDVARLIGPALETQASVCCAI
ncbi:Dabb family protein [Paenibacillus typhae]|uniref:Stress responsive A/B Barrel Domain n=1 Tax=Paenibacillus typhae TaxID=1174501 RepID=A0A1G8LHZ9_9BACL|nr:Dabb family protein [Paenibacillus typhae]SDI55255.1 Stress responsive A/B Barrel Domain [Paenibacillus typhae]